MIGVPKPMTTHLRPCLAFAGFAALAAPSTLAQTHLYTLDHGGGGSRTTAALGDVSGDGIADFAIGLTDAFEFTVFP